LLVALGFGIWCSALSFVYVIHGVGCTFDWPANAIRLGLGLVILVHLAIAGWLWAKWGGPHQDDPALDPTASFLDWVILWTLIAAFVTIVFTLGPTLLLTTCT
jgi:phage shock protein PspC (stress-responsive transcriptional regulator)